MHLNHKAKLSLPRWISSPVLELWKPFPLQSLVVLMRDARQLVWGAVLNTFLVQGTWFTRGGSPFNQHSETKGDSVIPSTLDCSIAMTFDTNTVKHCLGCAPHQSSRKHHKSCFSKGSRIDPPLDRTFTFQACLQSTSHAWKLAGGFSQPSVSGS